ncbi:MAG: hypothetical protein HYZ72_05130 [Deltaproteobacteria bacterium]|nr:hypothetical protein [Deltaproteobacteria bacterium]
MGYGASEVGKAYARARELCRQVRETAQLFPVLLGLHRFYVVRGELQTARELAEQCLALAQREQDPALLLEAHYVMGAILFVQGEIARTREHIEQGIALYDPQQHRSHALLYGHDPGVACLSHAVWVLWFLGYPDQALKRSHEVLALAQELSHLNSLAYSLWFAAMLHVIRREWRSVQERAEALIALSTEQGFPLWLGDGTILQGWTLAEGGQREEGIAQIRQGLAAKRTIGGELRRPQLLALLAGVYRKVGQAEEGLSVLSEALAAVDKTGERYYEAELYRLKGELTLKQFGVRSQGKSRQVKTSQGKPEVRSLELEAEKCFHKAIEIARRQSAKSLELRAVMSLARLWQSQGKKKQARQMLAEIYGWFTEGFDTVDLQEAKALLEELS